VLRLEEGSISVRAFVAQLKDRLVLSSVVGRHVRLTRKGSDYWGPCPFHKENSPSFVVHDDKGRYHCFGCGVDGDAITFIENLRNVSFVEAVEELASTVGMTLPERSERFLGKTEPQSPLYDVLKRATVWFQKNLTSPIGSPARDYLEMRGIRPEESPDFYLGWAPSSRTSLWRKVSKTDFPLCVEAGLIYPEAAGKPPRDRFWERLIFPIHNDKGQVIAFGGRTIGSAVPKYVNSPETPVFDKGEQLYGLWQSKKNLGLRQAPVVLVEGYLDVIALQKAGLARALAPLGTALGEAQLLKAWRLSPQPILCFDGDSAGAEATLRTVLKALPLLKAGVSLDICHLPQGEDPQSLLQTGQGESLKEAFTKTTPLVDYLWNHLIQAAPKTPEARAQLRKRFQELCQQIRDEDVRKLYLQVFEDRFREFVRPQNWRTGHGKERGLRPPPKAEHLRPPPVRSSLSTQLLQLRILLLTVLNHPFLGVEFAEELALLPMPDGPLNDIRCLFLEVLSREFDGPLDLSGKKITLDSTLHPSIGELLLTSDVSQHALFSGKDASEGDARMGFKDVFECYQKETSLAPELVQAQAIFAQNMHEDTWKRLQKLKEIYNRFG
jgi:DNA primase